MPATRKEDAAMDLNEDRFTRDPMGRYQISEDSIVGPGLGQ